MTNNILVAAPHPDDETLGAGGALLRHVSEGDLVHWLIMSSMDELIYSSEQRSNRAAEVKAVVNGAGFASVHTLPFASARLDSYPIGDIIASVSDVFSKIQPNVVYVPFRGDAHTDHAVVFDAVTACTKWFRYPFVSRVLAYETISETDFSLPGDGTAFVPNLFVDIAPFLDKKIELLKIYGSELGSFPFPRSEIAVRSLAAIRGATSGYKAAESFMLLRERY